MKHRANILFPVEIINREIDYRLFLACAYARDDNRIYIGRHTFFRHLIRHLDGGVYLGKNLHLPRFPEADQGLYREFKQLGFTLLHFDEEGAVHPGDAQSWKRVLSRRLDPGCLASEDFICTWGDFQRDYYRSLQPACAENIVTTGHPRFDLYRTQYRSFFDDDVCRLRERYGDFVLLNTNLFRANNRRGLGDTFSSGRGYNPADTHKRRDTVQHWAYHSSVLGHFIRLITHLSIEMPHVNFVVRPHPSEKFDFYETIFKDIANIHVVHEGSVGPWLLAARALIHDGCTTAIEAHFCGTPILNYKAVADERYDKFLPNIFGVHCHSEQEAQAELQKVLQHERRTDADTGGAEIQIPEEAHALFANFRHDAFAPVMAALDQAVDALPEARKGNVRAYSDGAFQKTRAMVRTLNPRRRDAAYHPRYGFNPFYGFENVDIAARMEKVQQILKKQVHYKVLNGELMVIEG